MLSVIIPAYNEELMIKKVITTIDGILKINRISYELIFVNDGSKDKTWSEIVKISQVIPSVKGINFSRNFGKEAAIMAGLSYAEGECAIVMDCDLQHPPEKIPEMYHLWQQGYEIVEGVKVDRGKECKIHTFFAKAFYKIISRAAHIELDNKSDFKLLDRKVINVILKMPEKNTFFRALSSWVGFKSASISFVVGEREFGKSKWSMRSLFKYAISNITSFTNIPMQFITLCSGIFFVLAVVLGMRSLYMYFVKQALEGFTTVILLILIVGFLLMLAMGIVGFYIAKIYEEVKNRPQYIVSETSENKEMKE